jgi:hypothetical protein
MSSAPSSCKKDVQKENKQSRKESFVVFQGGTRKFENDKSSIGRPSERSTITRSTTPPSCYFPRKYHLASLHAYTSGHIFSKIAYGMEVY